MTSAPERRKHGACLLRFRENCPFRKLRKNKCGGGSCYVIQRYVTRCVSSLCKVSSISESVARRWGCSSATVPLLADPAEAYPQTLSVQPYFHLHHHQQQQQQDYAAMDAEAAPSIAGPAFSTSQGPYTGPLSSASNLLTFHHSSLSASDHSMELDNCVDPETGERALG